MLCGYYTITFNISLHYMYRNSCIFAMWESGYTPTRISPNTCCSGSIQAARIAHIINQLNFSNYGL